MNILSQFLITYKDHLSGNLIPLRDGIFLYIVLIFVFFEPDLRSQAHSQQALLLSLRQLPFANDMNLMITILLESLVLENETFPM